jgi:hypothetical protein
MKKFLAVAVTAAALSLTGCSMIPGATPQPTVTVTPSAEPTATQSAEPTPSESTESSPEASSPEASTEASSGTYTYMDFTEGKVADDEFVAFVRDKTTAMTDVGDGAILLIPGKACAELGNGGSFMDIVKTTSESIQTSIETKTGAQAVYTPEIGTDAGFIVGAGVMNYCPQFEETLKAQIPHTNQ